MIIDAIKEKINKFKNTIDLYKILHEELIEEGSSDMLFNIYTKEMDIDGIKCTVIFLQKNGKTVNCAVPIKSSNEYIKIAINELLDYIDE